MKSIRLTTKGMLLKDSLQKTQNELNHKMCYSYNNTLISCNRF